MTLPTTHYRPNPSSTDSEYNELRKAYERLLSQVQTAQSQASTTDQLRRLVQLANQNGLYVAADAIRFQLLKEEPQPLTDWEINLLRSEFPDGYSLSEG